MSHFKGLTAELQKQVCAMHALTLYNRYYKPEWKFIDYNDATLYGSLDNINLKYTPGGAGKFADILNNIKPELRFGVMSTGTNFAPLKQNMLWYFAR